MKSYLLKSLLLVVFLTGTSVDAATFSANGIAHIKERHWHNAKASPPTSHFPRDMTVKKLDQLATQTIQKGVSYLSKNGNGNSVHEYTFKKTIGATTQGKPARTLRVVLNPRGEIVTAFPIR
ncbi:MAG: hypothetical protein LLG04_14320 [Parachlamydia sp.]|nr:hypothetical protein [Parachlamydia sp.]